MKFSYIFNHFHKKWIYYKWQSEEYNLNLPILFEELKKFNYALLKIDVPYMPTDFPKHYPIGKDIDILCSRDDFDNIIKTIRAFIAKFGNFYDLKEIEETGNVRIRLENFGWLHLQFDIKHFVDYKIDNEYIKSILAYRIYTNGYFVLPCAYETIFRLYEVMKNPHKTYHKDFLLNNFQCIDPNIIPHGDLRKTYEVLKEKVNEYS